MQSFLAWQVLWETSVTAFRLSILAFYIEVFPVPKFRRWAYGCVALVMIFFVTFVIVSLTLCHPFPYFWDHSAGEGKGDCGSTTQVGAAAAMYSLIVDIVTVLLPVPVVWKLQMPKGRKISIICVFALGFLYALILSLVPTHPRVLID